MALRNTPPFILAEGLQKSFGTKPRTIGDLGLEVEAGDFVTLLGPSGCGKSTLLKLLAGLSSLSGGSIRIDGMSPRAAREFISFIFQDSTLLPWRTVSANIALALEFEGMPREGQRPLVEGVLKLVGLSQVAGYYPRQLSGGMKMRVSIARALITTPRLLLMDEPFGALDEITRNHLNEEVLRLKEKQNWTAVFVTHSVHEAVFLSNRVMLMRMGPGRITREIPVPFAFPRTAALRRDPEYLKLVGVVSDALAEND
jgi:NitT/TauT family transport system ATP-binding protein